MFDIKPPGDWGIADKSEWVADLPLSGEGVMPALEGRDVVGFSESVDFAVTLSAATKQAVAANPKLTTGTDASNKKIVKDPSTGAWHKDKGAEVQERMGKAIDKGAIPKKNQDIGLKSKVEEKPQPKQEEKQVQPPAPIEPIQKKEKPKPSQLEGKRTTGKDFSLELTETNEQFLQKMQDRGRTNGSDFVDLRKLIGEQSSIPPRHLDALSRMLVTQGSDTTPWSDFGGDVRGGAGKIYAQAGELMTLAFSSLPPDQAKNLQSAISEILAAQRAQKTKNQIVTDDWFKAAQNNTIAINNAIKSNSTGDVSIIGGAWDVKGEVEELGMNDYDSEKGFSTDIYLKLSDGSLAQISLKKDSRVNFLNSGAGSYGKFIISSHATNAESPHHEQAKAYFKAIKTRQSIIDNLPNKVNIPRKKDGIEINNEWNNALKTISEVESEKWAEVDATYNNRVYSNNEEDRLRSILSSHGDEVKQFDIFSIPTDAGSILKSSYISEGINEEETKLTAGKIKKLPKEEQDRINNMKDRKRELSILAGETAKENSELIRKAKSEMEKRKLDWPQLVDAISSAKVLNRDSRKLIHLAATNQNIDGYKEGVQKGHKDFISAAINAVNSNPDLSRGMLEELKENFPIRDVAEGKEIMAIGDLSFDSQTCRSIFGTNDFDIIKTGFKVTTDENGVPYLGWMGKAGGGPTLPLAKINIRQDGVGYGGGNIKHEMVLHQDFASRLRQANAQEYGAGSGRTFSEHEFDEPTMKKQPTYEDYMEILKARRVSNEGGDYADSMVFYRGKALGRCPAGTTRIGKTCAPSTAPVTKGSGYKPQDLGGLSQAQVTALSKAKSTQDIINAHKKQNKQ